jgi:hypothetical protein
MEQETLEFCTWALHLHSLYISMFETMRWCYWPFSLLIIVKIHIFHKNEGSQSNSAAGGLGQFDRAKLKNADTNVVEGNNYSALEEFLVVFNQRTQETDKGEPFM